MKKLLVFISALAIVAVLPTQVGASHSYTYSNFAHGNMIDNTMFRKSNSMTQSQIQSFLNSTGGELASKTFGGKTAARIIKDASTDYGVNPQVIIATLQKEQSLITHPNPEDWRYRSAMGYDCPTTGECNPDKAGFANQVDNGTWQLRLNYERANGNNTWWNPSISYACGSSSSYYSTGLYAGNTVGFRNSSGSSPYRIATLVNAATAALYCYTPHAYSPDWNGSYNFVISFEHWFGSTQSGPLEYEPLDTPRWMQLKTDVRKKNLRLGVDAGSVLAKDTQLYFLDKISINDQWFLRTRYDSDRNKDTAIPLSTIENLVTEYIGLDNPREMEARINTHNRNVVTEEVANSVSAGTRISFDTKVSVGGRWHLRSEDDTYNNLQHGVPMSAIQNIMEFEELDTPRWMQLKSDVRKRDPRTGKVTGGVIPKGTQIYFEDKVLWNGHWYLRSKYDSDRNNETGFRVSEVENLRLNYTNLETPRWMQARVDTYNMRLDSGESLGDAISAGTPIHFTTKVFFDGQWYLRTASDTSSKLNVGVHLPDIENLQLEFVNLDTPREMELVRDAFKKDPASGQNVDTVLKKGRKIFFNTKVKVGDTWYLRTQYDTSKGYHRGIPYSSLQ
jgi:hypothetical protein